jgi:DNA (cytosine-5)-methyltransferase 1
VAAFTDDFRDELIGLRGRVKLVAGGPPCQGFSFAGKRCEDDPRNQLFRHHLEIVDPVKPSIVLMENVQGIDISFKVPNGKNATAGTRRSYAARIKAALEAHGYRVVQGVLRAADFGVPQLRPRYFTFGFAVDMVGDCAPKMVDLVRSRSASFRERLGLPVGRDVTLAEAISDLLTLDKTLVDCEDADSPDGFKEALYDGPKSAYQELMHGDMNGRRMDSMRLVNHRPDTVARFRLIQETCRRGVQISPADRERLGIRKSALTPLSGNMPSHTITTLPDDLLHYCEPRVHTVREQARIQSFPDWFEFRGKYTTGGTQRTKECPRYTQVGNAVPPLLAQAVGEVLIDLLKEIDPDPPARRGGEEGGAYGRT